MNHSIDLINNGQVTRPDRGLRLLALLGLNRRKRRQQRKQGRSLCRTFAPFATLALAIRENAALSRGAAAVEGRENRLAFGAWACEIIQRANRTVASVAQLAEQLTLNWNRGFY